MVGYSLFKNGERIKHEFDTYRYLWFGQFSVAHSEGSIVQYIASYLKHLDAPTLFLLHSCDGNIPKDVISSETNEFYDPSSETLIVATLGQVQEDDGINYLYLPLDDNFFDHGVSANFDLSKYPSWEERKPIAFWRGGFSGDGVDNSLRRRAVRELMDFEHADVKMTRWGGWERGHTIPENQYGNRVEFTEFFNYKMVLIIDGNVIASSHMWAFATGCVPFLLSNATCWFTPFLKPFENYIPIQYDLSDLKEKIQWVVDNDAAAKHIAENAVEFSRTVFSSEFQKQYLREKIDAFVNYKEGCTNGG